MNYLNLFPVTEVIQGGNVWTIPLKHQWTKMPLQDNTVYLVVTNWCGYSKAAKEPFLEFIKYNPGYFIDYDDPQFKDVFNITGVPTVYVMHNSKLKKIPQNGTINKQLHVAKTILNK